MGGRIGKVRMKATGFEFRVISGPPEPESDFGARMMACARALSADPDLVGYAVIALSANGYRIGFRWDDDRSAIPRSLFPSYMAEVLRREMLTAPEAEAVFYDNFQWID